MSTTDGTDGCDRCGAGGALDEQDYCVRCAADTHGWEQGRRMQALLQVAIAVDAAVDSPGAECTPEQVRAIVENTLSHGGYSADAAIAVGEGQS